MHREGHGELVNQDLHHEGPSDKILDVFARWEPWGALDLVPVVHFRDR